MEREIEEKQKEIADMKAKLPKEIRQIFSKKAIRNLEVLVAYGHFNFFLNNKELSLKGDSSLLD